MLKSVPGKKQQDRQRISTDSLKDEREGKVVFGVLVGIVILVELIAWSIILSGTSTREVYGEFRTTVVGIENNTLFLEGTSSDPGLWYPRDSMEVSPEDISNFEVGGTYRVYATRGNPCDITWVKRLDN